MYVCMSKERGRWDGREGIEGFSMMIMKISDNNNDEVK